MRSPRSPGWAIFGVLSVVFMLSPLVLVVLMSFGSNEHATFPLGSLTLDWYRTLLSKPDFYVAASNSVNVTTAELNAPTRSGVGEPTIQAAM